MQKLSWIFNNIDILFETSGRGARAADEDEDEEDDTDDGENDDDEENDEENNESQEEERKDMLVEIQQNILNHRKQEYLRILIFVSPSKSKKPAKQSKKKPVPQMDGGVEDDEAEDLGVNVEGSAKSDEKSSDEKESDEEAAPKKKDDNEPEDDKSEEDESKEDDESQEERDEPGI